MLRQRESSNQSVLKPEHYQISFPNPVPYVLKPEPPQSKSYSDKSIIRLAPSNQDTLKSVSSNRSSIDKELLQCGESSVQLVLKPIQTPNFVT
ncbi:uncharacterized [Tachysurus ichikawai]